MFTHTIIIRRTRVPRSCSADLGVTVARETRLLLVPICCRDHELPQPAADMQFEDKLS